MWQLSPASRTREAVDDCLVPVPWCRAHTIAAHAVLVLFPHFRRYTRRLLTCRRSNRTCRARRLCFVVARCLTNKHDKWRKSFMIYLEPSTRRGRKFVLCGEDWAVSLVRHCDPTLEIPTVTYRYFRREGLSIPPYWWTRRDHHTGDP